MILTNQSPMLSMDLGLSQLPIILIMKIFGPVIKSPDLENLINKPSQQFPIIKNSYDLYNAFYIIIANEVNNEISASILIVLC